MGIMQTIDFLFVRHHVIMVDSFQGFKSVFPFSVIRRQLWIM